MCSSRSGVAATDLRLDLINCFENDDEYDPNKARLCTSARQVATSEKRRVNETSGTFDEITRVVFRVD